MGKVFEKVDLTEFEKAATEASKYIQEDENKLASYSNSASFNLVYMVGKVDLFLDPLIGLLPGVGDIVASIGAGPALYVALFKIKSLKLTFAIIYITIVDILCGLIPVVGDIVDIFHQSNKKAARWIAGYVENDQATIEEVDKASTYGVVVLIIIGVVLWLFYSAVVGLYHWLTGLVS